MGGWDLPLGKSCPVSPPLPHSGGEGSRLVWYVPRCEPTPKVCEDEASDKPSSPPTASYSKTLALLINSLLPSPPACPPSASIKTIPPIFCWKPFFLFVSDREFVLRSVHITNPAYLEYCRGLLGAMVCVKPPHGAQAGGAGGGGGGLLEQVRSFVFFFFSFLPHQGCCNLPCIYGPSYRL